MLGNMAHDSRHRHRGSHNKGFFVRTYSQTSDIKISPEETSCNKYHKSAAPHPEICIWQRKTNAEMGIMVSINLRSRGRGDMITGHLRRVYTIVSQIMAGNVFLNVFTCHEPNHHISNSDRSSRDDNVYQSLCCPSSHPGSLEICACQRMCSSESRLVREQASQRAGLSGSRQVKEQAGQRVGLS